jgi:hypothetical protein
MLFPTFILGPSQTRRRPRQIDQLEEKLTPLLPALTCSASLRTLSSGT